MIQNLKRNSILELWLRVCDHRRYDIAFGMATVDGIVFILHYQSHFQWPFKPLGCRAVPDLTHLSYCWVWSDFDLILVLRHVWARVPNAQRWSKVSKNRWGDVLYSTFPVCKWITEVKFRIFLTLWAESGQKLTERRSKPRIVSKNGK